MVVSHAADLDFEPSLITTLPKCIGSRTRDCSHSKTERVCCVLAALFAVKARGTVLVDRFVSSTHSCLDGRVYRMTLASFL